MRPEQRPRRVLAYARVSSADQGAHGASLDAQREEITRYCSAFGYPSPTFFVEVESGAGAKQEARAQQVRLEAMVVPGDLVIVSKIDRWSRDTIYFLQSVDRIAAKGGKFFSLSERFDPTSPEGRLAATMMASYAEHERMSIRARTVGNRQRLRRLGFWVEGPPPLGYVAERRGEDKWPRLYLSSTTAPVVRRMFALCLDGLSTRDIAMALCSEFPGVPGLDGPAVAKRLRDRRYLGDMPATGKRGRFKPSPETEWIVATHAALIDVVTWRRAQDAVTNRKMGGPPLSGDARNAHFLLRGLARCGNCGRLLMAHAPMPYESVTHDGYYMCRYRKGGECDGPTARRDKVDARVGEMLLEKLEALRTELSRPPRRRVVTDTPDFVAERQRQERRRGNIVEAIADGTLTNAAARVKLAAIDDAIAAIDQREAEHALRVRPVSPEQRRVLLRQVEGIRAAWRRMTVDDKRDVLAIYTLRVTIARPASAKKWARQGTWTVTIDWKTKGG